MLLRIILKRPARFIVPLLALLGAPVAFAEQENRVALLIGNAAYPDAQTALKDPAADASALADELRPRGFDVEVGKNLNKEQMQRAPGAILRKDQAWGDRSLFLQRVRYSIGSGKTI